jgi:4-amino-4-deoxy-L-arabinose transferase-like glycosyltransferase
MSSKTDAARDQWVWIVLLTVTVAAVLRFIALGSGLWYDEIVTLVRSARLPIRQIVTEFPGVNAHPLYSVLAHIALSLFGESAWALRLPAALFGIASVAAVYFLAARVTTRIEAWIAAAVLATSYHHIWFSQNARGYTVMGFLALVATHTLLRANETARGRDYAIYALACAAGVYTHLTMAFVVAGHAAAVVGGRLIGWAPVRHVRVAPLIWSWAVAAILALAAYAPFMSGLVADLLGADAPRQAAQVATARWAISDALRSILLGAGVPAALAGGAFAAIGTWSLWRRQPLVWTLLIAPAVVTGLAIGALGHPLRPRFFFFLSAAAAIFVGRGIGATVEWYTTRRTIGERAAVGAMVACTFALVALSAMALPRNYRVPKQDFEGAVRFAEAAERRGALITAAGPACLPLEIYYGKSWPCLETVDDLRGSQVDDTVSVLNVSTLTDYIVDSSLREFLRSSCAPLARFPGTLGGGDIVVCDAGR